ncbi:MAG: amidohydrolase family protein [Phycisphaerales bacterium]|nr:MAG: amidohydrolase family protein [Phycisphaerales bacterium]
MSKIALQQNTEYALEGRVVTMEPGRPVISSGVVYIRGDSIVDVKKYTESPPPGFTKKMIIKSGGTIYPGLIELHNHLSYNIIPMWMVPKQFADRDQWRRHEDYKKKMTGPMKVLGHIDGYLQAIVRYVECKLLFSGVTSSQGITLASHPTIQKHYKGIVRNVEQTVDRDLPDAETRISDIDSKEASKLLERLERPKTKCYLIHLAEGIHSRANKHFKALQISTNKWAITDALAGIHCVGLLPEDFEVMGNNKGSMIWSPMSNLLLYGAIADIVSAKENNLLIGLGSDWSASGSKNLLCELKVARLISDELDGVFSDEELIQMVTINAAKILKWDHACGSLEKGKKADLLVLRGKTGNQYKKLIDAKENAISFVVIDGWPRIGYKRLMNKFDIKKKDLEEVKIGGSTRYMYLENEAENVIDIDLTYAEAQKKLKKGMANLQKHALDMEATNTGIFAGAASLADPGTRWHIISEHEDLPGSSQRHHLPYENEITGGTIFEEAAVPLSQILESMPLDPATIAGDRFYFNNLALQKNLPEYIKLKLPRFYGKKIDLSDLTSHVKNISATVRSNFDFIQSLSRYYDTPGYLNLNDRLTIIDQAMILLEQGYVHRPLKRALHASNPLERLRILRNKVLEEDDFMPEIEFHKEIIRIFNSLRDLHTAYQLPAPFYDKVAFVPFFMEVYFDAGQPRYVVSRLIGKSPSAHFKKGVEITHWNHIPVDRAVKANGDRYAGSNPAARFARGLDSMTFRPLAVMLPPEEEAVTIQYLTGKDRKRQITVPWMVGPAHSLPSLEDFDTEDVQLSAGFDYLTRMVQSVKKSFFAFGTIKKDNLSKHRDKRIIPEKGHMETTFPGHFRAFKVPHGGKSFGYIRIFSFMTNDPQAFVAEFIRLLKKMPKSGIILDVRNNGGGNILAAEWILQALSPKRITPEPAQFINTNLVEELCRLHSPSATLPELDLTRWNKSLSQVRQTGAVFTLARPITPLDKFEIPRPKSKYKIVLITDALCYSATDIFSAGFKDHNLGKIMGIHENTGAGGANVWPHSLLYHLTMESADRSKYFKALPYGANFTIAIRRTLRVGQNAGIPLEDLGVRPDFIHQMTKRDLLERNEDLIAEACEILKTM